MDWFCGNSWAGSSRFWTGEECASLGIPAEENGSNLGDFGSSGFCCCTKTWASELAKGAIEMLEASCLVSTVSKG